MTYTLVVPKELLPWLVKARADKRRSIREQIIHAIVEYLSRLGYVNYGDLMSEVYKRPRK
jgi:hypothetical protein